MGAGRGQNRRANNSFVLSGSRAVVETYGSFTVSAAPPTDGGAAITHRINRSPHRFLPGEDAQKVMLILPPAPGVAQRLVHVFPSSAGSSASTEGFVIEQDRLSGVLSAAAARIRPPLGWLGRAAAHLTLTSGGELRRSPAKDERGGDELDGHAPSDIFFRDADGNDLVCYTNDVSVIIAAILGPAGDDVSEAARNNPFSHLAHETRFVTSYSARDVGDIVDALAATGSREQEVVNVNLPLRARLSGVDDVEF